MVSPSPPRKRPRAPEASDTATAQFGEGAESTPPTAGPPAISTEETHQKLLHGEPVLFDAEKQTEKQREVPAEWIEDAVRRKVKINLQHAIIPGPLNLKYAVIEKEFSLQNCHLLAPADFTYCTFKQNLLLSRTTLANGANFQSATMQYDAFLDGAKFLAGEATFRDIHVQGVLYAQGTHFGQNVTANFNRARIDKSAFFHGTSFGGETNFGNIQVGSSAEFQGAVFRQKVSFNSAKIAGAAFFRARPQSTIPAATFEGEADFTGIEIGSNAEFEGVVFKKNVSFNAAKIDGLAFFRARPESKIRAATFESEADFTGIEVGSNAEFQGAVFKKNVSFDSAKIEGSAFFGARPESKIRAAIFEGEANFRSLQVGSTAEFKKAVFKMPTTFANAQIGGSTIFHEVQFLKGSKPSFQGTLFRQGAFFQGARFEDAVNFRTAQFDVEARFLGVTFAKEANFDASRFTGLANFSGSPEEGLSGAVFKHASSFEHARFEHDVRFDDTLFQGKAGFREASFLAVYFSQSGQAQGKDQFQESVDLRGCTYERIQVNRRLLLQRLVGTVDPDKYDRQPYTQLEKVLRTAGQDRDADDVYLERRRVEHKRKWQRGEFGPWLLDTLHALFANYGVRPYQLLYTPILILLLGTALFFHPDATHHESSGQTPSEPQKLTGNAPDGTNPSNQEINEFTALDAARLSLRYFLPVEVPLATHWEASDKQYGPLRFSDYATGMKLAGWILVPLGIAALTGLLRRVTP